MARYASFLDPELLAAIDCVAQQLDVLATAPDLSLKQLKDPYPAGRNVCMHARTHSVRGALAAGMYFVRVEAEGQVIGRAVVLAR